MRTPPTPLSLALSGTALRPLAASSAFLLALAGCGGGGSSGDAPATLTGTVAVDQAIQNAVVCMDLNANNLCDTGEPVSAKTGANGAYSLTYDPLWSRRRRSRRPRLLRRWCPAHRPMPTPPSTRPNLAWSSLKRPMYSNKCPARVDRSTH